MPSLSHDVFQNLQTDSGRTCDGGGPSTVSKANDQELRVKGVMLHCVHFTGIQHDICAAGLKYSDVRGAGKLPCLQEYAEGATCDKAQFPTEDEARQEVADVDAAIERHMIAHRTAHDDAKTKRFGKGQGGADSVECPVCKIGRIYYRVAGYNGHMHAKCETDGCVSWIE